MINTDPFGISRVINQPNTLPQQAEKLDPSLPLRPDELLIEVECLNIDSASFRQIEEFCAGDEDKTQKYILNLVESRGKHHNPVTGSGGMLLGKVVEVGSRFPIGEKPVLVGDEIASLVSLTLTPLKIRRLKKIHFHSHQIEIEGHAILFSSGIFARLPKDIPRNMALAVLDVCGAPAQTKLLVRDRTTVLVVGGGGKSGALCLFEAKRKSGVKTVALEFNAKAAARLKSYSFVDEVIEADATNPLQVREKVLRATGGKGADLVINVANLPNTEMGSILSAKPKGIVYFFSMATSFSKAALGAEGLGADVDLRIGNGYTPGHADLALQILRDSPEIKKYFRELTGQ